MKTASVLYDTQEDAMMVMFSWLSPMFDDDYTLTYVIHELYIPENF